MKSLARVIGNFCTALTRVGWPSHSLFTHLHLPSLPPHHRRTPTDAGGGLFPAAATSKLWSHWLARCPGGHWLDQSRTSLAASQWFGGGHCVRVFNESFVVWQFRGVGARIGLCQDFPVGEKLRCRCRPASWWLLAGVGGDQGSPTLGELCKQTRLWNL